MDLIRTVEALIEERELLDQGDGVIVGCSGGPDSMCLLHLLMGLQERMELTLKVVHLEHGFRGDASERDAQYVEDFCEQYGIPCVIHREQVRELAKQAGISEETAGREARYRHFFRERENLRQDMIRAGKTDPQVKIAVAHNKNDQAETILMRIMRGTGLEGLCGMELKREDGIIRPLLTTDRSDIESYCEQYVLEPRRDLTNEEAEYTRNRIRLELLPYMKGQFNDNVEDALIRLAAIASESCEVIREEAQRCMSELRRDERGRVIDREGLAVQKDGIRHEILRQTMKAMGLTTNVSAVHLHQIDELLCGEAASGSVDLPGGYRMSVGYGQIAWQSPDEAGDEAAQERRSIGEITVSERRRGPEEDVASLKRLSAYVKCFDADKVNGRTLELRTRLSGDYIRPLGSPGRKKLQDWFVDQKVPRQVRDTTPLVCIGSEVLWIVGYRVSENYKVDEQTKRLIFVEFHQ